MLPPGASRRRIAPAAEMHERRPASAETEEPLPTPRAGFGGRGAGLLEIVDRGRATPVRLRAGPARQRPSPTLPSRTARTGPGTASSCRQTAACRHVACRCLARQPASAVRPSSTCFGYGSVSRLQSARGGARRGRAPAPGDNRPERISAVGVSDATTAGGARAADAAALGGLVWPVWPRRGPLRYSSPGTSPIPLAE